MKPKIVREKTSEELVKQAAELKDELFRLKFKHSIGQLEQTSNMKSVRNSYARIQTVLREREMSEGK